jgi:hypothetical protein
MAAEIVAVRFIHHFLSRVPESEWYGVAIVVVVLWGIVFYGNRQYFSGIFVQRI